MSQCGVAEVAVGSVPVAEGVLNRGARANGGALAGNRQVVAFEEENHKHS